MHLLIFGLGYTGRALAQAAAASGLPVTVATRQLGAAPPPGVALAPFDAPPLGSATHLVATAAPDADGDPVLARHAAALAAAPGCAGSATCPPPASMATAAAAGSTRPPSPARPARAGSAGWRRSAPGPPSGRAPRSTGCGWPASTGRAARCWTTSVPAGRAGWSSRGTCSAASTATTSRGAARCIGQDRPPGARVLNGADDEPAASADVVGGSRPPARPHAPAGGAVRQARPAMSPMAPLVLGRQPPRAQRADAGRRWAGAGSTRPTARGYAPS